MPTRYVLIFPATITVTAEDEEQAVEEAAKLAREHLAIGSATLHIDRDALNAASIEQEVGA